jgi:hypothetical protein
MKRDLFTQNYNQILSIAKSKKFYTYRDLQILLENLKRDSLVAQSLKFDSFFSRVIQKDLHKESIHLDSQVVPQDLTRYYFGDTNTEFDKALMYKKDSFLSLSTSLNFQGLSTIQDNIIYTSSELNDKSKYSKPITLTQQDIDNSYSKEARKTKSYAEYGDKFLVLLTPKYSNKIEVIEYNGIPVSSINRALVEIIVNSQYYKSTQEIINIFKPIKKYIDLEKVNNVLIGFNYIYPFHQCVGFFLEQIGFKREELGIFHKYVDTLVFYTRKQLLEYRYDDYWKIRFNK